MRDKSYSTTSKQGVVATASCQRGGIITCKTPYVSVQSIENRQLYLACDYCHYPILSPSTHLALANGSLRRDDVDSAEEKRGIEERLEVHLPEAVERALLGTSSREGGAGANKGGEGSSEPLTRRSVVREGGGRSRSDLGGDDDGKAGKIWCSIACKQRDRIPASQALTSFVESAQLSGHYDVLMLTIKLIVRALECDSGCGDGCECRCGYIAPSAEISEGKLLTCTVIHERLSPFLQLCGQSQQEWWTIVASSSPSHSSSHLQTLAERAYSLCVSAIKAAGIDFFCDPLLPVEAVVDFELFSDLLLAVQLVHSETFRGLSLVISVSDVLMMEVVQCGGFS